MARIPPPSPIAYRRGKYPTFMDLVSGQAQGRTSKTDITLYIAGGNQGLQFAAVGWLVYQKARELGLGRELPTEWFLQDIRD
jgi:ornithine cyclodeaminase/alanine dehydrogenase-like protein (mu-crystallin family)